MLGAQRGEAGDQAIQDPGAQGKKVELAFARDSHQACPFQFLDVMGERGRGDGEGRAEFGAAQGAACLCNAFEQFIALGIGECLEDRDAAGAAETRWLGRAYGWGRQ